MLTAFDLGDFGSDLPGDKVLDHSLKPAYARPLDEHIDGEDGDSDGEAPPKLDAEDVRMDVTSEGASTSTAVRLSASEQQRVLEQPNGLKALDLYHGLKEVKQARATSKMAAPKPSKEGDTVTQRRVAPEQVDHTGEVALVANACHGSPDYLARVAAIDAARTTKIKTPDTMSMCPDDLRPVDQLQDVYEPKDAQQRMDDYSPAQQRLLSIPNFSLRKTMAAIDDVMKEWCDYDENGEYHDSCIVVLGKDGKRVGGILGPQAKECPAPRRDKGGESMCDSRECLGCKLTPLQKSVFDQFGGSCRPVMKGNEIACANYATMRGDPTEVREAVLRKPSISGLGGIDLSKHKCAFQCKGCLGVPESVQTLYQIHKEAVQRYGNKHPTRKDSPEAREVADKAREVADEVVVGILQRFDDPTQLYDRMMTRVLASACCRNGNCKTAAGIWDVKKRAAQNARPAEHQHANQVNGNVRYGSDEDFYQEVHLARRLFKERKINVKQAQRMHLETGMFTYWFETRKVYFTTAAIEFGEHCRPTYGLPYSLERCQEIVDMISRVPFNHVVYSMGNHAMDLREDNVYGEHGRVTWDTYLRKGLAKKDFPDPWTSMYLLVKVFNWEAEGMPVLLRRGSDKPEEVFELASLKEGKKLPSDWVVLKLIDRVQEHDPTKDILCGTADVSPANFFSNMLWDQMSHRLENTYELDYVAAPPEMRAGGMSQTFRSQLVAAGHSVGGSLKNPKIHERAMDVVKTADFLRRFSNDSTTITSKIQPQGATSKKDGWKTKKLPAFSPACNWSFLSNNTIVPGKLKMAAAALGLNARYARWLKNFEDLCGGVGTFFLVATRDRDNHPGHRIAPSAVYAPVRPVRTIVTPLRRVLEKPSATVGIGKQGAVKLGKVNRTYFGPDNPSTMRGQGHSLMGMPYPPLDPPRVSMLDKSTVSSLSPKELLRIEEIKEKARLAAATSYQTCLVALQNLTVEPPRSDSPTFAQEQELDAAQARWITVADGNMTHLLAATDTMLRIHAASRVCLDALQARRVLGIDEGATPLPVEEAAAHELVCRRFTPDLLKALQDFRRHLVDDMDPAISRGIVVRRSQPIDQSEVTPGALKSYQLLCNNYELLKGGTTLSFDGQAHVVQVLDFDEFTLDVYARNSVERNIKLWFEMKRNEARWQWWQTIKKWYPELVQKPDEPLTSERPIPAEWDVHMSDDPANEADAEWTTPHGDSFNVRTHADYKRYALEKRGQAVRNGRFERLKHKDGTLNEKYEPSRPPLTFAYWCSGQQIDPDERWPNRQQLRRQFQNKVLCENEAIVQRKQQEVRNALHEERAKYMRKDLTAHATDEQKKVADAKVPDNAEESETWQSAWKSFSEMSEWVDDTLTERLDRWVKDEKCVDEATNPDEEVLLKDIQRRFEEWLETTIGGGYARWMEQQRAQAARMGYGMVEQDRLRLKAEYERQKSTTSGERRHQETMRAIYQGEDGEGGMVLDPGLRDEDRRLDGLTNARTRADASSQRERAQADDLGELPVVLGEKRVCRTSDGRYVNWRVADDRDPFMNANGRHPKPAAANKSSPCAKRAKGSAKK